VRPCPAGIPAAPATDENGADGDAVHDDARGP
jgi:hypothetical protein